jgi:hypothetical protein
LRLVQAACGRFSTPIDDQFALVQALLSPDRIALEAIYAAPFHNTRSTGPSDGMDKSYDEILRLLGRMGRSPDGFVFTLDAPAQRHVFGAADRETGCRVGPNGSSTKTGGAKAYFTADRESRAHRRLGRKADSG